jgi:LacI family transcriptional regulator
MADAKHVMLVIETSKVYGRALLEGIGRYARAHGGWSLFVEERGLSERHPTWLAKWRGDGIIFRSTTREQVAAIQATGLPAVDTNSDVVDHGLPLVYADEAGIAEAAAQHFLERSFQHFAFCAHETRNWVDWRRQAYLDYLALRGITVECLALENRLTWDQQRKRLADWVRGLPKPAAILAGNDVCGMRLIDACRSAGLRVPEEVAVLGVDNDEVICNLTSPPLSSVDPNAERIGYEAAALLDRLIAGGRKPSRPVWVRPAGVITRQSTDIIALDDPEMVQAISYIRANACQGINVEDVVDHVAISRATLERRFASLLDRSPKEEILRIRIDRVKRLLADTDYPLLRVAELTGFKTHAHLSVAFKRAVGQTVGQYRLAHRPKHAS